MNTRRAAIRSLPDSLPREISSVLRGYALRVRGWNLLLDAALLVIVVGVFVGGACLFDRFVDVVGAWRRPLPWIAAGMGALLVFRLLWRVTRPADFDAIALTLDRASGDSRDHLRTLLDSAGAEPARIDHAADALRRETLHAGLSHWRSRSLASFVSVRRPLGYACFAGILIAVFAAAPGVEPLRASLLWQRFLHPTANLPRPSATWFESEQPMSDVIRAGDDYALRLLLRGRAVADAMPRVRVSYADGTANVIDLTRTADGSWRADLPDVRQNFTWVATLHEARTAEYSVRVMPRPTVIETAVTYEFPGYSRIKSKTEKLSGRTITALEGSKIRIEIVSNTALREVVGTVGPEARRFRVDSNDPNRASLFVVAEKTQRMAMSLTSVEGVESKQELPFTIRAVADNPPVVSLTSKPADREYSEADVVLFAYKAQDDIGLSEIVMRIDGGDDVFMKFGEYGATQTEGSGSMTVADLVALAGKAKEVKVRIVARDTKGQEASSESVTLRLAADSVENQLRFVRKSMTTDPVGHNRVDQTAVARAASRVVAMRAARGRLAALIDGLKPGAKLDKDQLAAARGVETQLNTTRPRAVWGTRWYRETAIGRGLLDRFRAGMNHAMILAEVDGGDLTGRLRAASESDDAKTAMTAMLPVLDAAIERQDAMSKNVLEVYVQVTRELAGLLASNLESRILLTPEVEKAGENFLATNRAVLQELAEMAAESLAADLGAAKVEALRAASTDKDLKKSVLGAGPLLREVAAVLVPTAREAALRSGAIIAQGDQLLGAAPRNESLLIQLGTLLELQNPDRLGDDLDLTQYVFSYLHFYNGTPGPVVRLGDRDGAQRADDEAVWRAYHALQWLRVSAMDARTRLATGQSDVTRPEFLDAWARMREARLTLESLEASLCAKRSQLSAPMRGLLAGTEPLLAWTPASDGAADHAGLVVAIRTWERAADALAGALEPEVRQVLRKLRADAASRLPELRAAFAKVRGELAAQGEKFEEAALPVMQLRLSVLQIATLKMLDLAEASRLAHVDERAEVDQLLGIYTLSGHLQSTFMKKVALEVPAAISAITGAGMANRERTTLSEHAWKSRVEEYKKLDPLVESLLGGFAQGFGHEQIQPVIKPLLLTTQYLTERQAIVAGASVDRALEKPRDLLAQYMADRNRSQAVYGELFYQVYAMRRAVSMGSKAEAAALAAAMSALLSTMPELPAELKTMPGLMASAGGAKMDVESSRAELVAELGAALEDLKTAMGLGGAGRAGAMEPEQLAIARSAAAVAMGVPGAGAGDVAWAVTRASLNRRKGGLSKKNVATGGVGLIGDETQELKLPRHLYLELKRSRERAMPELFRDRAYEYLNTILEKAQ